MFTYQSWFGDYRRSTIHLLRRPNIFSTIVWNKTGNYVICCPKKWLLCNNKTIHQPYCSLQWNGLTHKFTCIFYQDWISPQFLDWLLSILSFFISFTFFFISLIVLQCWRLKVPTCWIPDHFLMFNVDTNFQIIVTSSWALIQQIRNSLLICERLTKILTASKNRTLNLPHFNTVQSPIQI